MKNSRRKTVEAWVAQFTEVPGAVLRKTVAAYTRVELRSTGAFRLEASPSITCYTCSTRYDGKLSLDELLVTGDRGECVPCGVCRGGGYWDYREPPEEYPLDMDMLYATDFYNGEWVLENKHAVARLGFLVFSSDDYGVLLGLDPAEFRSGYDTYEACWRPLYELLLMTEGRWLFDVP